MGTGSQISDGDDVLCGIGQEEDGVGDDEDRHGALQWEKGVDIIPKEHDADDKEDAGAHFREKTCGFEDLAILFVFSHRKHDERPPYGAESGAGNAKGKAAFDGGESIILRLTEKFGVVREGEMTCHESEPTQLDESGVSVIRLLLPPTSESLLLVVMAFCTIQRRRQMVTSTEVSDIARGAGGSLWQLFSLFCREDSLLIVSEKSLMTGFP